MRTSSNTGNATVVVGTGVVTGVLAGTPTISYTLPTGCFVNTPITVNTNPPAIGGANNVCVGSSTTLNDGLGGGNWTSSNTLLATVVSTTGIVNGVAVGNPFISYTMPTGCYAVQAMTVNPNPAAITGATFMVCTGSTITLSDATAGGTWGTSNGALATVSPGGVVTGVAFGTPTISYTMGTSCYATQQVTVNTTPNAITGSNAVCIGYTTILSSTTGGGSWSSAAPAVASVGAGTGVVTGVAAGSTTITYMMPSGCYVTYAMAVNPNPAAITGTFTICTGTSQTLGDATAGGTWASSNPGLASVVAGTGVVTGNAAGNPTISYSLGTGCYALQVITVNPSPAAIGGQPRYV